MPRSDSDSGELSPRSSRSSRHLDGLPSTTPESVLVTSPTALSPSAQIPGSSSSQPTASSSSRHLRLSDDVSPRSRSPKRRATVPTQTAWSKRAEIKSIRRAVQEPEYDDGHFDWGSSALGAEPGVDPEKASFKRMTGKVSVQVVDWCSSRSIVRRFDSAAAFLEFLYDAQSERPSWSRARWINVDGLNWSVIRELAIRHKLHPLALEDAIKFAAHSHSKSDWYKDQLFTRVLIHTLCESGKLSIASDHRRLSLFRRCIQALGLDSESRQARAILMNGDAERLGSLGQREHCAQDDFVAGDAALEDDSDDEEDEHIDSRLEEQLAAKAVVQSLTSAYRVPIDRQQLSTFLMPDGVLISIYSHDGSAVNRSVFDRLHTPGTILRTSEDASMLLQSLLDVVVDELLEITEEFRRELDVLEGRALINPETRTVRHLHVLTGQLLNLKRTVAPIANLIDSLRHRDVERTQLAQNGSAIREKNGIPAQGFISREAKTYLSDVNDHVDAALSSLELFATMATSIVDFVFQTLAFSSNQSMTWLTFITIIFLPLSFLTGYMGMNYQIFPEIGVFPEGVEPYGNNQNGSIAGFWRITGPLIAVLLIVIAAINFSSVFLGLVRRGLHALEKKRHRRLIKRVRAGRKRKSQKVE